MHKYALFMRYCDDIIEIWKEEDVVWCKFQLEKTITKDMASFTIDKRIEIAEGKPHKAIIVYKRKTTLSYRASKIYASEKGKEGLIAAAIVCHHPITRNLARFFSKSVLSQNPLPIKVFKDEDSAKRWIKGV